MVPDVKTEEVVLALINVAVVMVGQEADVRMVRFLNILHYVFMISNWY